MLEAIGAEIEARRGYLKGESLSSIYFGGGTPSLLTSQELSQLLHTIGKAYAVDADAEITLEANPDDLTEDKLRALADAPINRLSIGIQSFFDEDLRYMHRAHDQRQAHQSIEGALRAGFSNLSMDLIFGSPTTTHANWEKNLEIATSYALAHLSCYALTVEPSTALAYKIKKGTMSAPRDRDMEQQFLHTHTYLGQQGYTHYEISNYAQPGKEAVHNTNYWKQATYLGVGPSAHSYNGASRSWNVANNSTYLRKMRAGEQPWTTEHLTLDQRYNEYVMTRIRTRWGCSHQDLTHFGSDRHAYFQREIQPHIRAGHVVAREGAYRLSREGLLFADRIAADLFLV